MQRQSLGSPSSSVGVADRPRRRSRASAERALLESPQRSIHLIPVLTLLCFLVLYLFSHEPSPSDLTGFHGPAAHVEKVAMARSHRGLKVVERPRHRKLRSGGGGGGVGGVR